MTIIYAPRALRDVATILDRIAQRSRAGAGNVASAIERSVQMSAQFPHTGGKTDKPGIFRRPLGKYRYTVFYRVLANDAGIEIVRVVHAARVQTLGKVPR
jgi:plasmid stabilization system protein ParE